MQCAEGSFSCIWISHALATWWILLKNPSLWKISPISFICYIVSNLNVTEIWILLFWAGCDSWGVIYWYKLKGPISHTIRLCERNMHLLILKCTGFRGQGGCWAAWWAQCYNTPVPHVCACCPQPATKQPPLQKFSVKHSCVSQLFTTCFQNWALYFLLWDKQTKSYQAAYKFPVISFQLSHGVLQSY